MSGVLIGVVVTVILICVVSGTTESQSGDPQSLIIIVSAAAVSGVLIGVVATVIVW